MWHKQLKNYKKRLPKNGVEDDQTKKTAPTKSEPNQIVNNEINFGDYCKAQKIAPFSQNTHLPQKSQHNSRSVVPYPHKTLTDEAFDFLNIEDVPKEFYRYGQKNLPKELRLNKYSIGRTLDLHNLTKAHALQLVEQLLDAAEPASCIKIIHGWGVNSEANQPILLGTIRKYLLNHSRILAYSYGALNQGGNGVTIAKLTK